jgi:DNA-binding HxlR family transcriptional regulator
MYEDIRRVIGPKRTLEILQLLSQECALNFSDIESRVATSSDVISTGLDTLVAYGLVQRSEESHRNIQYSITDRGNTFLENINEIEEFLTRSN